MSLRSPSLVHALLGGEQRATLDRARAARPAARADRRARCTAESGQEPPS
jgi:hypothetical protein